LSRKTIQKKIVRVLKRHPEGLPISTIARLVGVHRHTVTKYVYELVGAGILKLRKIGTAKVCILKERFVERVREEKILERLKKRVK
jgi:DNA-binding Lrp family transcriptional regulator